MGLGAQSGLGSGGCYCGMHMGRMTGWEKLEVEESSDEVSSLEVCSVPPCRLQRSVQYDSSSPRWGDQAHLLSCCWEVFPPPGEATPPTGTPSCQNWRVQVKHYTSRSALFHQSRKWQEGKAHDRMAENMMRSSDLKKEVIILLLYFV